MISVIVPVFNSGSYLSNCLDSILNQTYSDLQVICVDDGSSDNSGDILDHYQKKDPRIQVIHQPNSGVSTARNNGIEHAKGDYITFVDSDDEIEPDMYECLIGLIEEYQADIAHCGYKKIFPDSTFKDVGGTGILLEQTSDEASLCLLQGQYFAGGLCNKLFRAELFSHIRLDAALKINEDVLANAQLFHEAEKVVFCDVPKYHYFERPGSSCSTTATLRKSRDCVVAAEKMYRLYEKSPVAQAAARKLHSALCNLYRTLLLSGQSDTVAERRQISRQIKEAAALSGRLSARSTVNRIFLLNMPSLYKSVYRVYDKIRKPNWDI